MLLISSYLIITLIAQANTLDIDIAGNIFFSDHYLMQKYSIRDLSDVEALIEHILDVYNNAGYPFCQVRPSIEQIGDSLTRIILDLQEGIRVTVADHVFCPDGKTDPGIVWRYIHPERDLFFSSKVVQKTKQRLLDTGAFAQVSESIVQRNDLYYLLWTLNEQQTDFISAFGTISEEEYVFSISLHSINLLGTLRRLEFLYEYEKLFTVQFTEPVIFAPTSLHGDLSLWSYDTMQLLELNGTIATPLSAMFDISLLSGIERTSYAGSTPTAQTNTILGAGLAVHVKNAWLATNQSFMVDYLVRTINRWRLHYDGSITIFDFSIRPHGRYVFTDNLEFFDYFRLGGAQSLRGYFEEELVATQAFWLNLEYQRIFIFPLIDIGYIEKNILFSYGFGISAHSSLADASLVLAWPKDGTWRDGMVHLIFEKGF